MIISDKPPCPDDITFFNNALHATIRLLLVFTFSIFSEYVYAKAVCGTNMGMGRG